MRVLEVRFYPQKKAGKSFLIVGRVYCEGRKATIEAASNVRKVEPAAAGAAAMLEKLDYLVRESAPHPFDQLSELRSDYWSFVEVDDGPMEGGLR
jgi:hypothetical protein